MASSSDFARRKATSIPTDEAEASSSISHSTQDILMPSISEMKLSDNAIEDSTNSKFVEEQVLTTKLQPLPKSVDFSKLPRRTPQHTSSSNSTALQKTLLTALSAHKHNVVEQLLNRGVSPNTEPSNNSLITAVYTKDIASLRYLLEFGGDPDIATADGNTPLRCACQHGHEDETKLLLEYGANPNGLTPVWTALAWALDGCYEGIIDLWLQYGTDPNAVMQNGSRL
jgi:ankyrin repeat protein